MLEIEYRGDDDTRIVEEMGVWSGSVRIDIAVINGELSGFELKSDSDTLERLPFQGELYSRVFDRVVLVAGERHADGAASLIPEWWGLFTATRMGDSVRLNVIRHSRINPSPDPYLVAQLLWKDEALQILESMNLAKGCRSKSVKVIHERLASELSFPDLSARVRTALKQRRVWLRQPVRNPRQMPVDSEFYPRRSAP